MKKLLALLTALVAVALLIAPSSVAANTRYQVVHNQTTYLNRVTNVYTFPDGLQAQFTTSIYWKNNHYSNVFGDASDNNPIGRLTVDCFSKSHAVIQCAGVYGEFNVHLTGSSYTHAVMACGSGDSSSSSRCPAGDFLSVITGPSWGLTSSFYNPTATTGCKEPAYTVAGSFSIRVNSFDVYRPGATYTTMFRACDTTD